MRYRPRWAVIFDCDGVIVDSEPLGLGTLAVVVTRFGLPVARAELDHYCGRSDIATYYDFKAEFGEFASAAEFVQALDDAYVQAVREKGMCVFPGVQALLNQLEQAHVPYGIGTSGSRRKVTASLTTAGIIERFPVIVTGDDVPEAKPAPDIFLQVAAMLQVEPKHCVVIEDSPTGVLAAKRAGMACVAVTTSFHSTVLAQADMIVTGVDQLGVAELERLCTAGIHREDP